jgi:hypothetical protein
LQFIAAGIGLEPTEGFVRFYHRSSINRTRQFMLEHELLTRQGDFNTPTTPGFYLFESLSRRIAR